MKSSKAMILTAMNAIIGNWLDKPEKFMTSTGFEAVTLQYRCDALTKSAMKPLTLGADHLRFQMFP